MVSFSLLSKRMDILIVMALLLYIVIIIDTVTARQEEKSEQEQQQQQDNNTKKYTKENYLVKNLDKIEPAFASYNGTMYAGLIPATEYININIDSTTSTTNDNTTTIDNGSLMFWYFNPIQPIVDDTVVIWLNGGPGCSSISGCLFEHGPVTIPLHEAGFFGTQNDPNILVSNNYTWTKISRIIYIEQPLNVGFSTGLSNYTNDPTNEINVGTNFYIFLQNFYKIFIELQNKKLYIFGESYAGMYVPSIAHYIHTENKKYSTTTTEATTETPVLSQQQNININLAGIGIGNGWIDVMIQGPVVIDYLWWHGMIDMYSAHELHISWENCIGGAIQKYPFHHFTTPDECGLANAALLVAGDTAVPFGSPNVYDVTTFDQYQTISSENGAISKFFNNPLVQDALNVGIHRKWKSCSGNVNGRLLLQNDRPLSMLPFLSTLLDEAQIDVLIYNGDRDLLANQPGSELALNKLLWSGRDGWRNVEMFNRSLYIDSPNSIGGYIKSYKNLHLLSVYNSGHMVPYNRPALAYDLLTRFISNKTFHDVPLPNHKAKIYDRTSIKEYMNDDISSSSSSGTSSSTSIYYDDMMDIEDVDIDIDNDENYYNNKNKFMYGMKSNLLQVLHNPVFIFIFVPIIFILGIVFGIYISRWQQHRYNGYNTIPPIPSGYTQRNERI